MLRYRCGTVYVSRKGVGVKRREVPGEGRSGGEGRGAIPPPSPLHHLGVWISRDRGAELSERLKNARGRGPELKECLNGPGTLMGTNFGPARAPGARKSHEPLF